jgi:hypothetical protein
MTRQIGRNARCTCGSGKKYKKCCLEKERNSPFRLTKLYDVEDMPPHVRAMHRQVLRQAEMKKRLGVPIFGHVRPLISAVIKGYRVVVVGKRIYYSPQWDTSEQFLVEYVKMTFGYEWGAAESRKPVSEQHPVYIWYAKFRERILAANAGQRKGTIYEMPATGYMAALLRFAYDLYIVENNLHLPRRLLPRLKNRNQFQGARYELFIVASLLKAGFKIEFENEKDGSSTHCELTATDKRGNKYSVEAKSRHRPGVLGFPGERENPDEIRIGIERLLHDALMKKADHERLIFLDVNVPGGKPFNEASHWLRETTESLKSYEQNESLPSALIVATNHPHHYAEDNVVPKHGDAMLGGFRREDLAIEEIEAFRKEHPEYWDLITAVNFLDEIPLFDHS